ncbi:uncharacterized protein LOC132039194 [Lycium ferocissimum]|uniref:uncharacterized protein LOC132039194 n=1 Tax=Lycium ferocissimum TaxID=112874 RepID=UPI002815FDE7|nr:uncharacterized protein LOC132039194 [Lycium ferocissimum]
MIRSVNSDSAGERVFPRIFALLALVRDGRLGSCSRLGSGTRVREAKGVKGASRLRVGSWNIGTLSGKSIELVKILKKRRINIACVQETKWVGPKAKDVDGYKLWFSGKLRYRNGVGILVDSELRDQVVECYAPRSGFGRGGKKALWEDLDEVVVSIRLREKLFIGRDLNGHIGSVSRGYDEVHGGFDFGDKNGGRVSLLDFAKAFGLMVSNSSFPKKEEHLVTFRSSVAVTQIDFLLLRKDDKGLCKDYKVIPSENLTTQHKLLVMDLEIRRKKKKKKVVDGHRPRD